MKKTTILLLGALMASVLPGSKAMAQLRPIRLKVQTLDRAPIASAHIYAVSSNDTLCVDPTDARFAVEGTATQLSTITPSMPLTFSGDSVLGDVAPLTYTRGVIVVYDNLGRTYVYGNADIALRNAGGFTAREFTDTVSGTIDINHMLYANDPAYAIVARDNRGFSYTSFAAANNAAADRSFPSITLQANLAPSTTHLITNPMALFLDTCSVLGTLQISADSNVYLRGGAINMILDAGTTNGRIVIDSVDSIGTLIIAGSHPWEIQYARVRQVSGAPSANITIHDGKFNQTAIDALASSLPAGKFFYNNTDADAATFKWKVSTGGYKVTFHDYNAAGGDSIARCDGGLIIPAPSRPSYVAPEWLFQHYYTDAAFTTPWYFDRDSVTSDTTLYAKWGYYDPLATRLVRVNHHLRNLDSTYSVAESVLYAVTADTTFEPEASRFMGFHDSIPMNVISFDFASATPGDTTDIDFYYNRNVHTLTWKLNYLGVTGVTCNFGNDTILNNVPYGATIEYPIISSPERRITRWNYLHLTMPDADVIMQPIYAPGMRTYSPIWNGPDTVGYNAQDQLSLISARIYSSPINDSANMIFITEEDTTYTAADFIVTTNDGSPATEGARNVYESPYTIKVLSYAKSLVVIPYDVRVNGIEVEKVRLYAPGDQTANVINRGTVTPLAGDDLSLNNYAVLYNDEEPGENKAITAYGISLTGTRAGNYNLLTPTDTTIATDGVILYFGLAHADTLTNGFDVTLSGYCEGSSLVEFHIDNEGNATNPDMYSLDYDSDLFTDVHSATINRSGFIELNIPEGIPAGYYTVNVQFWDNRYPTYKSNPVSFTFKVNLSKNLIRPLFEDVITIVDTCDCIQQSSVIWYHNGDSVGSGPYYQQEGGLTGEYYAEFVYVDQNGDYQGGRTCVQTDFTAANYPEEAETIKVNIFPNPTVNTVNISLENATQFTHTLRVMNIMGVTMVNTTFDGNTTSIDFSRFTNGSYTVSVDGIVVRVIKK